MMPVKVAADTSRLVLSPMPGLLTSLAVEEGQEVKAGEALAVVEAMKMENVLRAERDGTVAKLRAEAGDSLAVDQVILEFAVMRSVRLTITGRVQGRRLPDVGRTDGRGARSARLGAQPDGRQRRAAGDRRGRGCR